MIVTKAAREFKMFRGPLLEHKETCYLLPRCFQDRTNQPHPAYIAIAPCFVVSYGVKLSEVVLGTIPVEGVGLLFLDDCGTRGVVKCSRKNPGRCRLIFDLQYLLHFSYKA